MNLKTIKVTDHDQIRIVSLNRPASLNSINYDVLGELEYIIDECKVDSNVKVVILKGEGRAFCAGDDIKGMGTKKLDVPKHTLKRADFGYPRFISKLRSLEKPVVAQVHGYALGAGCDLALSCDLIYAEKSAKFGLVFAKRGMVAGTALLPQLIGYQRICEILFTGDLYSAEVWKRYGIVNEVFEREDLEKEVMKIAEKISRNSVTAIGLMKRGINQSIGVNINSAIETLRYIMAISYKTHDFNEGRNSFIEKRNPNFSVE